MEPTMKQLKILTKEHQIINDGLEINKFRRRITKKKMKKQKKKNRMIFKEEDDEYKHLNKLLEPVN